MRFLDFFKRRRRSDPVVDLSTPSARSAQMEAIAMREAEFQRARPVVDFSRRPAPPPKVRRRGEGDPPPMFQIAVRSAPPPAPRPMCPDVID